MREVIGRYPLGVFFSLAFGVAWIWDFLALGLFGWPMPANTPGVFLGVTGAAFVVTAVTEGRDGVRSLLSRYVRWRVGLGWYLLAIAAMPAVELIVCLAHPGAFAALSVPDAMTWLSYLGLFLLIFVVGGPLAEEPGWRGFALPRLQERLGPVRGTIVLGALHGVWHLPKYLLVPGYNGAPGELPGMLATFGLYIVTVTLGAFHYTWLFNRTRGSLIPVMLLHAATNSAAFLPQHMFGDVDVPVGDGRIWVFAVTTILLIAGTRGRLSYRRVDLPSAPDGRIPARE